MDFFKPIQEDEKLNNFAEIEKQNEKDLYSYDPDKDDKDKFDKDIVAQGGSGSI